MDFDRPMTWGETWMAIEDGDFGVILATLIEVVIMASPVIIIGAVYFHSGT